MNNPEIVARAHRAEAYRNEFLGPALDGQRQAYLDRMATIATQELDPKVRADKITALATALRILDNVTAGIDTAIRDGEMAQKNLMRAEEVERMGPTKRKLFAMAPSY